MIQKSPKLTNRNFSSMIMIKTNQSVKKNLLLFAQKMKTIKSGFITWVLSQKISFNSTTKFMIWWILILRNKYKDI